MTSTVILPWPPKELSPNARLHWRVLALAKKAYRAACAQEAKAQGIGPMQANGLHVSLVFVPPNRRAFDLDGLLSRMKSGLDGLADVVEIDDSKWRLSLDKASEIGGFVRVSITPEV